MNDSGNDEGCQRDHGDETVDSETPFVAKLVRSAEEKGMSPQIVSPQMNEPRTGEPDGDDSSLERNAPESPMRSVGEKIGEGEIRFGSPFRTDPPEVASANDLVTQAASGEAAYGEFGPFLYTAMGASAAGVLVLFFAGVGAWWFPPGGALVSVLGTILSIVGLFSTRRFRYTAVATLPMHMGLFFFCYARTLS